MKITTSIIALAAATLVAASLTSCMPIAGASSPQQPTPAGPDTITPPSAAPEPEAQPDLTQPFGNAVTYADGTSIAVSIPAPYTPAEYASGADHANNVAFTITLTNGTDKPLDAYVYTTATSGGQAGSPIFDLNTNIPSGTILPGQSLSWIEPWSVVDPASIVFTAAPGIGYEDAIFTNSGDTAAAPALTDAQWSTFHKGERPTV